MYILVTYDVATSDEGGARRLRRVAKICLDYGQRVQNSVFECKLDPAKFIELKSRLTSEINDKKDSLRFYHLGNNWEQRIDHIGAKQSYNINGPLIL
ncbi:MAG: CRISPR-associated endonuclease Cas2 [Verrucomicrobiota bacterium]|nr:CRISPR-associated endonuclease Cas2 [Verrucomicrobiota bacterium]